MEPRRAGRAAERGAGARAGGTLPGRLRLQLRAPAGRGTHDARTWSRGALGVLPSAEQVRALEARYLDDCGFSYVRLLDELRAPAGRGTHDARTWSRGALGVLPSAEQVRALEARYLDDCGFSYVRLLDEVHMTHAHEAEARWACCRARRRCCLDVEECPAWAQYCRALMEERPAESAVVAGPSAEPRARHVREDPLQTDIVQILAKIKGKMVREGVRTREFLKQFDPRNELVIPRADFYRGLASSGLALTPVEMDTLMEVFCAPARRRFVEYERFCSTVGEALTQPGLERAPLLAPVPHVPTHDSPLNFLNFEERNIVSGALKKLSKFPDQLSNIMEVFEDMDKEKCGTIPRVSVERALCQRNLLALVSARERDLVYKCFGYQRGCGEEVNYRALVNALSILYATASAQPC
ncbi:hypothetical protein PYW07_016307 [Mythimna separata]|uniref:Uncharacterized protein n=1 Tax=Mythimna separata TaxID=271217 RepID=A0AAD7YJF2_MYTSE|nr:hypothetical protein PYW07_016307 [Mythimna separata]